MITQSMKKCLFEGCSAVPYAKGLCAGHDCQRRRGKQLTPLRFKRRRLTPPIIEYDEVECPRPDLEGPCHVYRGTKSSGGYGHVSINGKKVTTHKYVWNANNGPVTPGKMLDHMCRVKSCCSIKHLREVTPKVNVTENIVRVRKTHCPNGHEYSVENTRIGKSGSRFCRKCSAVRCAIRHRKKQQQKETHGNLIGLENQT